MRFARRRPASRWLPLAALAFRGCSRGPPAVQAARLALLDPQVAREVGPGNRLVARQRRCNRNLEQHGERPDPVCVHPRGNKRLAAVGQDEAALAFNAICLVLGHDEHVHRAGLPTHRHSPDGLEVRDRSARHGPFRRQRVCVCRAPSSLLAIEKRR